MSSNPNRMALKLTAFQAFVICFIVEEPTKYGHVVRCLMNEFKTRNPLGMYPSSSYAQIAVLRDYGYLKAERILIKNDNKKYHSITDDGWVLYEIIKRQQLQEQPMIPLT